jgi:hypothetical protein
MEWVLTNKNEKIVEITSRLTKLFSSKSYAHLHTHSLHFKKLTIANHTLIGLCMHMSQVVKDCCLVIRFKVFEIHSTLGVNVFNIWS